MLYRLKLLAELHSHKAFSTFRELASVLHDRTALYTCFYGMALADNKDHSAVEALVSSSLSADRKVELLSLMEPAPYEYLELLEKTDRDTARIILLRVICDTDILQGKTFYDRIIPYLAGSHEVRIAAVNALSSSHMDEYLPQLKDLYYKADSWQLRAVLSSAMARFRLSETRDILVEMAHDKAWWVRYNAVLALSKNGEYGLRVITGLSAEGPGSMAASMAAAYLDTYHVS